MDFELNIKNVGKLDDAKIRIGQFTVLAGPNNTGKSTVSKLLYSLFSGMSVNPIQAYISDLTKPIDELLSNLQYWYIEDPATNGLQPSTQLRSLDDKTKRLGSFAENYPLRDVVELRKAISDLDLEVKDIVLKLRDREMESIDNEETEPSNFPIFLLPTTLGSAERCSSKLQQALKDIDTREFTVIGVGNEIENNLIKNFQVPILADLSGVKDAPSEVDIGYSTGFHFSNEGIHFFTPQSWLEQLQKFSEVIYLESSTYWKLRNALEDVRISSKHTHRRREKLGSVPKYFYDLSDAIRANYTGDMAFPDIHKKITEEYIKGKIILSETGELLFQENGRTFPLSVVAMGVVNIGMLAFLIERKVLDKDSFLFIDEPEAHLHPAWQVVMAEILFELAKKDVNVVIATHSADILKWLEVHIKKNPDDKGMIALNKFPANGHATDEQDFSDKMAEIKQELTKPFADLYMAGL